MGIEKGPDFYNVNMSRVIKPLEESPWLDVYEAAASLLPEPNCAVIADIGCGTGRFARLISNKGYTKYWGVDFSDARIREARRYVPEFQFSAGNILDPQEQGKLKAFNTFVFLEVIEHISEDKSLFSIIPAGSTMIFSVPNFNSKAHVRYFNSTDEVIERYEMFVDFKIGTHVILPRKRPGRLIFLFSGIKK